MGFELEDSNIDLSWTGVNTIAEKLFGNETNIGYFSVSSFVIYILYSILIRFFTFMLIWIYSIFSVINGYYEVGDGKDDIDDYDDLIKKIVYLVPSDIFSVKRKRRSFVTRLWDSHGRIISNTLWFIFSSIWIYNIFVGFTKYIEKQKDKKSDKNDSQSAEIKVDKQAAKDLQMLEDDLREFRVKKAMEKSDSESKSGKSG